MGLFSSKGVNRRNRNRLDGETLTDILEDILEIFPHFTAGNPDGQNALANF